MVARKDLRPRPSTRPPRIHPLLIPHIINQISKSQILKRKDLLHMREVCQAWRSSVTPTIGQNLYLDIGGELGDSKTLEVNNLSQILKLVEAPEGTFPIPHTLVFDSNYFSDDSPRLLKFLEHISYRVMRLEDQNCSLNLEITEDKSLCFPNLKKFGIVIPNALSETLTAKPSQLLNHKILRSSPNLNDVMIYWDVAADNLDPKVLAIESDLLQSIPTKTVKTLTIAKPLTHSGAQIFSTLTWSQLNYLTLDFRDLPVFLNADEFCHIFDNCKDILTNLEITNYKYALKLPVFTRVIKLTLVLKDPPDNSTVVPEHHLQNFSFHFPAVETLDILLLSSDAAITALFPSGFTAPQVKAVRYPYVFRNFLLYYTLSKTFTGLKTLHLTPVAMREELIFRIVFKQLTRLEELHINFEQTPENYKKDLWMDSSLTGICNNCCDYLTKYGELGIVENNVIKSNPGIIDLTNLKALYLRAINPKNLTITDITGYLALLKMKSLTVLKMNHFQVSKKCLRALTAKFGDLRHTDSWDTFVTQMQALPKVEYLDNVQANN